MVVIYTLQASTPHHCMLTLWPQRGPGGRPRSLLVTHCHHSQRDIRSSISLNCYLIIIKRSWCYLHVDTLDTKAARWQTEVTVWDPYQRHSHTTHIVITVITVIVISSPAFKQRFWWYQYSKHERQKRGPFSVFQILIKAVSSPFSLTHGWPRKASCQWHN